MAEERFSPVNEISEANSPLQSPDRPDITNQSEHQPAEPAKDSPAEETPTPGREANIKEDLQLQLPEESDPSIRETSKHLEEGEITVTSEYQDPTHRSVHVTDVTSELQETCAHCHLPLNSQTDVKAAEELEYTKPIPLPKQGISYIETRNYLSEQGFDIGLKPSHEKRTYIIGKVPDGGTDNNVFDYGGLVPELAQSKPTCISYTGTSKHTPAVNYRTVGPILPRSHNGFNMSLYRHQVPTPIRSGLYRSHEREELQHLNDRFSSYVQTVRRLGEEFNQLDSSSFLHSCKLLEEQMENLKNLYEKELESIRRQLDDSGREKSQLRRDCEKHQQAAESLQKRLSEECKKTAGMMDEVTASHRKLSQMEMELSEVRSSQQAQVHLHQMNSHMDAITQDNQALRGSLEKQQRFCEDYQARVQHLEEKLQFDDQVNRSTVVDLRERLEAANNDILNLESRLREQSSQPGTNIGDMLTKVRGAAAEELQKYQAESEERFHKNMTALRAQVEEDSRRINNLRLENEEFVQKRSDLETHIKTLQGKINSLEHQNKIVKDTLASERNRYANQVSSMEAKARDMQELLMEKMQEANVAREMQIPLKAEIEAFKVLLEEEEKRLRRPVGSISSALSFGHATSGSFQYQPSAAVYSSAGDSALHPTAPPKSPREDTFKTPTVNNKPARNTTFSNTTTAHVYTYQTSPSINQLNIETSCQPSRVRSAPANRQPTVSHVSTKLGQGRDYFDEMFTSGRKDARKPAHRPHSTPVTSCHDYNTCTSSAVGDLKVLEVHKDGRYVRIENTGNNDTEVGDHMIQQNVGGHPVAVFRFPPHTRLSAHKTLTVWSGTNDPMLHQPPTDFVWKEQEKWGAGPECTTILCKPNGQAVAWTTAAHRFARNTFEDESRCSTQEPRIEDHSGDHEALTETHVNGTEIPSDPVYLRREKQSPPSLSPTKHPHGSHPGKRTHPQTCPPRPLTSGNDNSSLNRQSRSQSSTPDPPPGQPYAGPSGQRIGYYAPPPGISLHGYSKLANKSENPGVTSMPPSAFMTPHDRFAVGLRQIQSQHHDYNSPMPRPPLYSAW